MRNFAVMNTDQSIPMRAVTVYCASSPDAPVPFMEAAYRLGRIAAERSVVTVTGAGATGLMAEVIAGSLDGGGRSVGVIPQFMVDRGWANGRLTELRVTADMHSRKRLMASLSQGAIALPGGPGTIEELMELMTWRQLGLHRGPVVICNIVDYYAPLLVQLGAAVENRLMRMSAVSGDSLYAVASTVDEAIDMIYPADYA